MGRTKNNGIDLAREIIAMTQEYNRVITARNNEINALEQEVRYHKTREEGAKKAIDELKHDYEMEIDKLHSTLETVSDIICKKIKRFDGNYYIDTMWDFNDEFPTLTAALEIDINNEGEDRENED